MERITRHEVAKPEDIPPGRAHASVAFVDVNVKRVDQFVEQMIHCLVSLPALQTYALVTIDFGSLSIKVAEELAEEFLRGGRERIAPKLLLTSEVGPKTERDFGLLDEISDCVLNLDVKMLADAYRTRTAEIMKSRSAPAIRGVHSFRINDLFGLLHLSDPPPQLIDAVAFLNAEVIAYLKKHPADLYKMNPRRFEEMIAEILASLGWDVSLTAATRDGGYDIFAISSDRYVGGRHSWLVECKRWSPGRKVGIEVVRGLYGVRELNSAFRGANVMIATTSDFSKEVLRCQTSRYDLELRNYENILRWIDAYRPSHDGGLHLPHRSIVLPEG